MSDVQPAKFYLSNCKHVLCDRKPNFVSIERIFVPLNIVSMVLMSESPIWGIQPVRISWLLAQHNWKLTGFTIPGSSSNGGKQAYVVLRCWLLGADFAFTPQVAFLWNKQWCSNLALLRQILKIALKWQLCFLMHTHLRWKRIGTCGSVKNNPAMVQIGPLILNELEFTGW